MKIFFLLASLALLLTSCGGGKIDLNNDEQVMEKLNTEERDGKFIYSTVSEGSNIKEEVTIQKNVLKHETFMNGRAIIDFDYEFTLGSLTESGRQLIMERCYGEYYYTVDDKIVYVTKDNTNKFDFVENRD